MDTHVKELLFEDHLKSVHQTETLQSLDILLSHRERKGGVMNKWKEQCAYTQI